MSSSSRDPDDDAHTGLGSTRHRNDGQFTTQKALSVWRLALERARTDRCVREDRDVYQYLDKRGLGESWEAGACGIISSDMDLPQETKWWPGSGFRVVQPLYDCDGRLASVQACRITDVNEPKVRFPKGSRAKGTVFASQSGIALLRAQLPSEAPVILGEGFTDSLALIVASPIPVLCVPGVVIAESSVETWVSGREVLIAFDIDDPGEQAALTVARQAYLRGASRVRRLVWPRHKRDACEYVAEAGTSGLEEFLRREIKE